MRLRRILVPLAVTIPLAALVAGVVWFNFFRDSMIANVFANMQPAPVAVSVMTVEPVTWTPGVEAIGTASASQGVELAVETGGIVQEILFTANERVEQGERLLQIRDEIERADLAAAEASLELSQTERERALALQERGVSTVSSLEVADANLANARSQVIRLTAILEQKAVEAPFSGVIGIPQVEAGQYVVAGTVFATLQDLDTMRVDFSIPEQQVRIIEIGMPVTATSEVGAASFSGRISGIEPRIDPNSRLITVRADVEDPDGDLNPGQFLRVRVELPEEEGVIALPQTALSSTLYGDSVYVLREGAGPDDLRAEQVFVKPGRRSLGSVEILSGVAAGDRVVTVGQNRLTGNARVAVSDAGDLPPAAPGG